MDVLFTKILEHGVKELKKHVSLTPFSKATLTVAHIEQGIHSEPLLHRFFSNTLVAKETFSMVTEGKWDASIWLSLVPCIHVVTEFSLLK